MDYAIYKTNDGKNPRVIYRFTQEACNHRAKLAAKAAGAGCLFRAYGA